MWNVQSALDRRTVDVTIANVDFARHISLDIVVLVLKFMNQQLFIAYRDVIHVVVLRRVRVVDVEREFVTSVTPNNIISNVLGNILVKLSFNVFFSYVK